MTKQMRWRKTGMGRLALIVTTALATLVAAPPSFSEQSLPLTPLEKDSFQSPLGTIRVHRDPSGAALALPSGWNAWPNRSGPPASLRRCSAARLGLASRSRMNSSCTA